ncbi:MAG: ATP-binding protein [Clostridia bacterium]|nr:ATP-binding protein [Clostridia bacterium]
MNTTTLKDLLIEYNKKKILAEKLADKNKQDLYQEFPKLADIDTKLSSLALSTMKNLAQSNDPTLISNLNLSITKLKEEKIALLKSIGPKANAIVPHYECPYCQDTGYISNGLSSQMCNCLKQRIYDIEYNKSNIYNLEKQNFDNFCLNFYSTEVSKEKYHSDISPRENMQLIQKISYHFIENFDNIAEKNLLFTGKTGLGKTFLSSCIANELLKQGKTVLYQTASSMLDAIISYRFQKQKEPQDFYDHLLNVDLLIIDDLGTEGPNNMKLVELFNLLNGRLLNTKKSTKTIISTNLSLQSLFETYDERIVSRIVGNYNVCYFFGEDIRFVQQS